MLHHRLGLPLCLLLLLITQPSTAKESTPDAFIEIPATPVLLAEVRQGGFVLYMRHGATDSAYPDQVPIDLNDCSTQRPLTDAGRAEIVRVGEAIRQAAFPIAEVYASPLCRAYESAHLAYGDEVKIIKELMYTAHLTSAEKLPVIAMTRKLLSDPVAAGSNRVIVAHAPNLADLMAYFPRIEGTLIIFRPTGAGGFEYLASIQPAQWNDLLNPIKAESAE